MELTDNLWTKWELDDGGRKSSGRQGLTGDCVVRSIAIAMERDYGEVYDGVFDAQRQWYLTSRHRTARKSRARGTAAADSSPRNGVMTPVAREYIKSFGWVWTPTMAVGAGCRVHLRGDELPSGRIIARLSKHFCAVVNGVVRDTYDPARGGTRCVYGYWAEG